MAEIDEGTYRAYLAARAHAKDAKAQADALADLLKIQAGSDTELTVNGSPVGTYDYVDRFPDKRFIKDHPELADQFMTERTESVLNVKLLERTLPDMFRAYQTRSLNISE